MNRLSVALPGAAFAGRLALGGFTALGAGSGKLSGADTIGYHEVRLDAGKKLVPWCGSSPGEAYDHVIRKVWSFWITMRNCPNGVPYYLLHQVWKPDRDDPRGLGGDQISMALSSWNLLYGYLGDRAVHENMRRIADYWIDHGMAPSNLLWGDLPYPYNSTSTSGAYDGDMRAGLGYLQPDKAASFGAELVTLYKISGERRYLEVATRVADRLVQRVERGDAENSPWPFRVHAATGRIHEERNDRDHRLYRASYTSNWTGALRLFTDLATLGEGNADRYRGTARLVEAWLKAYPLKNNRWGPFFEDVSTKDYSDTEINADTLAAYILEHPEWGPDGPADARRILDWSYRTFANPQAERWGVGVINEQTQFPVPGNSHTARHAATELLLAEKTGETAGRDAAIRRLSWSTYAVDDDGRNRYPGDDIWLTDGYGDFVRHYLRAMASDPELAPPLQNHLLRSSSVIRSIAYGRSAIRYEKFDPDSEEVFRLGAAAPLGAKGASLSWDPARRLLRVASHARAVTVTLSP
jgi:hypothetical protein